MKKIISSFFLINSLLISNVGAQEILKTKEIKISKENLLKIQSPKVGNDIKLGVDKWTFVIALAGPIANITTQEIAFAKFGVYNQLVTRRIVFDSLNLSLPIITKFLLKKVPHDTANANMISIGAWGFFDAGKNIHVMMTLKVK